MLKAILFDLDDTLIDWSAIREDYETIRDRYIRNVFSHLCLSHPLDNADAFVGDFTTRMRAAWMAARDTFVAPNLGTMLIETALALGVPPDTLDARACMEAYQWGAIEGSIAFPETASVLAQLRERGIRLGLVTNAFEPMWVRDPEMEAHGLSEFFIDCRMSAADFGYIKPHPSIFKACMDCLGVGPDETVFVGDDLNADISGAQSAGIFAVLRRNPINISRLNGHVRPDAMIDNLTDLLPVLDEVFPGWGQ